MGFFSNIIKDAIGDGISKGVSNAVGKAIERVVEPKAEAYANKVADSLDEATKAVDEANTASASNQGTSSLESSLERMAKSMEKYAAAMESNVAAQEDFIKEWEEKLPGFPVWCFGGHDLRLDASGETADGQPYYWFYAEDATQEGLDMYVAVLKENGFVRKYSGSDEVLYKDLGGEYLVFGKTDAFGTAPVMSVTMVRTTDKSEVEA